MQQHRPFRVRLLQRLGCLFQKRGDSFLLYLFFFLLLAFSSSFLPLPLPPPPPFHSHAAHFDFLIEPPQNVTDGVGKQFLLFFFLLLHPLFLFFFLLYRHFRRDDFRCRNGLLRHLGHVDRRTDDG